jgi:transglutaminase-like putative cysteine protease
VSAALRGSLAGVVATLLASLALMPAFGSQEWLGATVLVVVFVATTGYGLRQLGTPRLLVPLGQVAALGWAFILLFAHDELRFGFLPSSDSVRALLERVNEGLLVVVRYAAPVPYDADLVMVTALGIGLVAIAVDCLCSTFRLAPWAGLPLLLLYSIPATTVSGGISALAFIPAAVGYIILLVSESRERLARWGRVIGIADDIAGPQEAAPTSLMGQTGRRVGAAVIGLAVIVPALIPTLPAGVFAPGNGSGFGGSGQTIKVDNPIVDLKRDLKLPQNLPIMTYRTDTDNPDYIKLVTLDEFDGERWKPSQRQVHNIENGPGEASQLPDPPGLDPQVKKTRVRTSFEVTDALESRWLPTPYPATTLSAPGDWGYDADTLDIVSRGNSSAGLSYEVDSLQIDFEAEKLRSSVAAPSAIFNRYTKLPSTIPRQVRDLARQHTKGARTDYDRAVALQRWFRNDFTYTLDVEPGHGESAMLEFLSDKRGYCEQFAATMAIMARSLSIPARVGVGYMPGLRQPDNTWLVTAHDSHAWPELYFAGYGWVRFEPTPQAQTGLAPTWTVPSSTTSPGTSADPTINPDDPQLPEDRVTPTPSAGPAGPIDPGGQASGGGGINPLPFLVAGGVLFVLSWPVLIRTAIRRMRLSARQPAERLVERVWQELADVTVDFGLTWNHAATPRLAGAHLQARLPQHAAASLQRLVTAVERTRYAPDPGDLHDILAALMVVAGAVRSSVGRRQQVLGWLLPVSLWRRLPLLWRPVTLLFDYVDASGARLMREIRRPQRGRTTPAGS